MTKTPLMHRFWPKVQLSSTPDGCWEWTGARTPAGYGNVFDGSRTEKAHRVAYMLTFGPIPADRELNHRCYVRHCVNPWHLEVVTHAENLQASRPALATHCPRGHAYGSRRGSHGRRECFDCRRIRATDRSRRARAGEAA